jgi:hypothetical protein
MAAIQKTILANFIGGMPPIGEFTGAGKVPAC